MAEGVSAIQLADAYSRYRESGLLLPIASYELPFHWRDVKSHLRSRIAKYHRILYNTRISLSQFPKFASSTPRTLRCAVTTAIDHRLRSCTSNGRAQPRILRTKRNSESVRWHVSSSFFLSPFFGGTEPKNMPVRETGESSSKLQSGLEHTTRQSAKTKAPRCGKEAEREKERERNSEGRKRRRERHTHTKRMCRGRACRMPPAFRNESW